VATARLRGLGSVGAMVMTVLLFADTAPAAANPGTPMPGMRVVDENMSCTASFAAHGDDGSYYFLTSGHCDAHNGSGWTYGQNVPLGTITVSENDGANRDAAIIRLDPSIGAPTGDVGGRPVHGVYGSDEIKVGMPLNQSGNALLQARCRYR